MVWSIFFCLHALVSLHWKNQVLTAGLQLLYACLLNRKEQVRLLRPPIEFNRCNLCISAVLSVQFLIASFWIKWPGYCRKKQCYGWAMVDGSGSRIYSKWRYIRLMVVKCCKVTFDGQFSLMFLQIICTQD